MSNSGEDPNEAHWRNSHHQYVNNINQQNPPHGEPFRHNEHFGMPGMYTTSIPTMPGSYTVLPVGRGNFVRLYHNENEPSTFNNYELFSSNSYIPHHTVIPQQGNSENTQNFQNNENAANMIINQLVTNWSPNASGTYSPFGEQHTNMNAFNPVPEVVPQKQEMPRPNSMMENVVVNNTNRVAPKTNGSFENSTILPEVKKRIVAEVKPMRMSYSDVLSKNVAINEKANNDNSTSSYSSTDSTSHTKGSKQMSDKNKSGHGYNDKKNQNSSDEKDKTEPKQKRFESQNSFKNDDNTTSYQNNTHKDKKKLNGDGENGKDNNSTNPMNKTAKKPTQSTKGKAKTSSQAPNDNGKRKPNKREVDEELFNRNNSNDNEKEFYYNVTKKDTSYDRPQKYFLPVTTKRNRSANFIQKNSFRTEKNQFYSKRSQKSRKNDKYELILKFAEKWYEYTLKILAWLFYLVYDIIVLGFGMVYDRISQSCLWMCSFFVSLRQELRNNSGKPHAWVKNLLNNFGSKFAKNSKWAFWRRFSKKKVEEPTTDFYKNGRLPQTGDEAMYSLLNCKGKDAYSILGVTSDSSQEQIRKHYKKIAVLVHPDKNKQPGAEEAFKVLQRAFELIGEVENRRSYDQSLAEALNAEKAWSELHDLLSQLQSKIAEAANTIRCSGCDLRHPRKLTERPHYAARECSSCKIRHSAREGDIWAETSIFGLRWKYLALMEGKVYDITEWANCQKEALSHLQPNSHIVQYRMVRYGQQEQQQQQHQTEERTKREQPSEPSLREFLDNIYSGQNPQTQQNNSSRRRSKRN